MKKVLITGSKGFIGTNLLLNLRFTEGVEVFEFDSEDDMKYLEEILLNVDFCFHLAGVNRPEKAGDFITHNSDLTKYITDFLIRTKRTIPVVLASTTQVELDNDYGRSKLEAEKHILNYIKQGGEGYIYRLANVFGKWCRPNYNSVVATFCYNIANGKEITITDRKKEIQLIHVDDIINDFKLLISEKKRKTENRFRKVIPCYKASLGEIADSIESFKAMSGTVMIPDMSNDFIKKLHSTYLSYVPLSEAAYPVNLQTDARGNLFELIKSKTSGQIFVSKTKPGIMRGNHFHHLKSEKFCVIEGTAVIKMRHMITSETQNFIVNGKEPVVVNILPGYTHSITNTGENELITLFWANELFDSEKPDTYFEKA